MNTSHEDPPRCVGSPPGRAAHGLHLAAGWLPPATASSAPCWPTGPMHVLAPGTVLPAARWLRTRCPFVARLCRRSPSAWRTQPPLHAARPTGTERREAPVSCRCIGGSALRRSLQATPRRHRRGWRSRAPPRPVKIRSACNTQPGSRCAPTALGQRGRWPLDQVVLPRGHRLRFIGSSAAVDAGRGPAPD